MSTINMPVHATQVGKLMAKSGLPKAGRYTPWGYVDADGNAADGYIVKGSRSFPERASVLVTLDGDAGDAMLDAIIEYINADGFYHAVKAGRRIGRHIGMVEVYRPVEEWS